MLSIFMSTCFQAASQISRANPKRPQTLKRGFVLEHIGTICSGQVCGKNDNFGAPGTPGCLMEPCTWPSQTCFVSLLGFVSFSTYFPIRNQLQLVTLWKGPRTLSIGCVWMASWVDLPQVCGDGAGAALLRGAWCGQASVTWWV